MLVKDERVVRTRALLFAMIVAAATAADDEKPEVPTPKMDTYSMVSWVLTVVAIVFVLFIAFTAFTEEDPVEEEDKKEE